MPVFWTYAYGILNLPISQMTEVLLSGPRLSPTSKLFHEVSCKVLEPRGRNMTDHCLLIGPFLRNRNSEGRRCSVILAVPCAQSPVRQSLTRIRPKEL